MLPLDVFVYYTAKFIKDTIELLLFNCYNVVMAKKRQHQEDKEETKWFWWEGDDLLFNVLGKPSAKITKIGKPLGNQLKISVAAVPVNGRATDHLVKFLAKQFDVKVRDIEVVFGRMNVNKQIRITKPNKLPAIFKEK